MVRSELRRVRILFQLQTGVKLIGRVFCRKPVVETRIEGRPVGSAPNFAKATQLYGTLPFRQMKYKRKPDQVHFTPKGPSGACRGPQYR